jgi:hypothetical protein
MAAQRSDQEFVGYPQGQVLAIIDDRSDASAVERELHSAGFSSDAVRVLIGEGDANKLDSDGTKHGAFATLLRGVEHLMSDVDHLAQYEGAIRGGAAVIAVHAPDEGPREQALEILRRHEGHFINYYGAMTVETLERG